MPLKGSDAVDAATNIINGAKVYEASRLEKIRRALTPIAPTVEIPDRASRVMRNLASKAQTNLLPLVLDTFSQVMHVDGYTSTKDPENDAPPWKTFTSNRMGSRQVGIHRAALTYGASYMIVTPGRVDTPDGSVNRAKLLGSSPRRCTAVYADPVNDEWPMLALYADGPLIRLYDETSVYFIGTEKPIPRSGLAPESYYQQQPYGYTFIERRDHDLGVCPVVRFRDRMLLDGEQVFGIVEPLITLQQRIDETVFGMLTAQFFSAFKQRYVIGWIPSSEEEKLKASASTLWAFKDSPNDVKVGELGETDLTRYISAKDSAMRDLASMAQVPAQTLGLDGIHNVSAEALAGLEAAKDRKTSELTDSLGDSWKQTLQLAALAEGDTASANDDTAQVHWQDASARSLAQTVDALGKLAQMLQIPPQALWPSIPGYTQTDVEKWRRMAKEMPPQPVPPPFPAPDPSADDSAAEPFQ